MERGKEDRRRTLTETREQKDRPGRDLIFFPIIFNVVAIIIVGLLFAFSPEHLVEPEVLNIALYSGVFVTEWSIAYVVIRRLGMRGVKKLIVPKSRFRWLPSIVLFFSLNVLFTTYMVLALLFGRIQPWGKLDLFKSVFFLLLSPLTAGFVEELIWRGHFIEKLLSTGKTEWKAILSSSVSFAFIHGFLIPDKLLVTFLFGVIAGKYYVKERNLPVLIASHIVLDVIAFWLPFSALR